MRVRSFIALGFTICFLTALVHADGPTTAPADSPAVKEVRDTFIDWNKKCAGWTLAQVRQIFHTTTDREAIFADFTAHEVWEESRTQRAVLEKWGAEVEAKFAHADGTDTVTDDLAADITVDGDHATVTFKVKEIQAVPMIKVGGHWLMDMHAMCEGLEKANPDYDKNLTGTAKLMKQAAADITANKFDDADAFLADIKPKLDALNGN
jgi:hypothetical protein